MSSVSSFLNGLHCQNHLFRFIILVLELHFCNRSASVFLQFLFLNATNWHLQPIPSQHKRLKSESWGRGESGSETPWCRWHWLLILTSTADETPGMNLHTWLRWCSMIPNVHITVRQNGFRINVMRPAVNKGPHLWILFCLFVWLVNWLMAWLFLFLSPTSFLTDPGKCGSAAKVQA